MGVTHFKSFTPYVFEIRDAKALVVLADSRFCTILRDFPLHLPIVQIWQSLEELVALVGLL